jgi:anti-anti-sigma factor
VVKERIRVNTDWLIRKEIRWNCRSRSKRRPGNAYIVSPIEFLNSQTYETLEDKVATVLDFLPKLVVMDMQGLEYLSSAGVRVILKTRETLRKSSGKLVFMNLQPQIKKVFDIINALPSMKIFTGGHELDEYLDAIQKKVKEGEL